MALARFIVATRMTDQIARRAISGLLLFFYLPYLYFFGYNNVDHDNVDFPTFYSAAQVVFEHGRSPYTIDAFRDDVALLGEPAPMTLTGQLVPPFLYPPPSLLLFYPLTWFSFRTAKLLLFIVNHASVLPILYLFCARITGPHFEKPLRHFATLLAIIYVLVSYPVLANFEYGQINLLVLLLLGATWYAVKRDAPPILIGLPLAAAVLLKTYPILLLPLLLLKKQYRAAIWVIGLLLLATAIGALLLPQEVWRDWLTNVVPTGGYLQHTFNLFSPAQSRNSSINGFVSRIFTEHQWSESLWPQPVIGRAVAYVLALGVMGTTLAVSFTTLRKQADAWTLDLNFCVYLLMINLVAPLTWESHLVFALPAAFLGIPMLLSGRGNRAWQLTVAVCLSTLAWSIPVDSPGLTKGLWTLVIPVKFYATILLWIFFIQQTWRSDRARGSTNATA
jgi:hypothetical protein